jgi:hypothetical protein
MFISQGFVAVPQYSCRLQVLDNFSVALVFFLTCHRADRPIHQRTPLLIRYPMDWKLTLIVAPRPFTPSISSGQNHSIGLT